ncbi:MAG: hypothetical protein DWQ08_01090 [Proteobacteria bacterium]|nr:MAG: hypothetical protein DWQ08_01090 [Pseudomonadota bacterium]
MIRARRKGRPREFPRPPCSLSCRRLHARIVSISRQLPRPSIRVDRYSVGSLCCIFILGLSAGCGPRGDETSRSAEATIDEFYNALQSENAALALSMLSRDVLVYEMGAVDRSRKEYATRHLATDMKAAVSLRRELLSRRREGAGDIRWVFSTYLEVAVAPDEKETENQATETIGLRFDGQAWRILHMHYSSNRNIIIPQTNKQ